MSSINNNQEENIRTEKNVLMIIPPTETLVAVVVSIIKNQNKQISSSYSGSLSISYCNTQMSSSQNENSITSPCTISIAKSIIISPTKNSFSASTTENSSNMTLIQSS